MAFPTTVDPLVDTVTVVHASQVLGPQRITVGPTLYNVKSDQYGALGDGSTDDTNAIQAALNACRTAGGGIVYFPAGTYMLSIAARTGGFSGNACAVMYGPNSIIRGAGRGSTTFRLLANTLGTVGTGSNNASMFSPWNVSQEQIAFEDFTFDGNGGNQTDQMSGLYLLRQRGVKVHRVRGQDFRGTSNTGGSTETFIYYGSGGADYSFIDCDAIQTAGTVSNGFANNGCTNIFHTNCRAINIGTASSLGFGFNTGTSGGSSRQVHHTACEAYLCGVQGYHIDSANCQNIIYSGSIAGGIASDVTTGQQYPFTSGQSLGNQFGFACLVAATNVLYDHCIAYGNSSTGFEIRAGTGLSFVGCTSRANGGAGINFNTGAPVANVIGGDYSGNTAFGIGMGSTTIAGNIRVSGGPTMTGNGTGPLVVAGTSYTPGGNVAAPSVPATTIALTNPFGYDADVYVSPGASTCAVSIAGQATGITLASSGVGQIFRVPAKESITLTYTSAPTWKWFID